MQGVNNARLGGCSAYHRPGTFLPAHPCLNKGRLRERSELDKRSLQSHRVHYSPWSVVLSLIILSSRNMHLLAWNFSQPSSFLLFYPRKVGRKLPLLTYSRLLLVYCRYTQGESAPLELLLIYNWEVGTQLLVVIYSRVTCYLF